MSNLVVILVMLDPQWSLSVVGKPSAKRPEAVMVSVLLIFDGMVLLRRSCNRSGMTRPLWVWSVVSDGPAVCAGEGRVASRFEFG